MTDAAASSAASTTPGPTGSQPEPSGASASVAANIAAVVAKARKMTIAPEPDDGEAPGEAPGEAEGKDAGKTPPSAESKVDDDASPDPKKEPALAGKFAALARKSEKVRQEADRVKADAARVAEREHRVSQYEQTLAQREAGYREFEAAKRDPKALISLLSKSGVDLRMVNEYVLAEHDPALRAQHDSKRALTELEQLRKERDEALERSKTAEQTAATQRQREESEAAFLKVAEDETKFEAANIAYSDAERLRVAWHLDKIAKDRGLRWGLSELAEAVNEFAEAGYALDPRGQVTKNDRYSKLKARLQPSGAQGQSTAASAASAQNLGTGPRATPAKTLTNTDAGERSAEVDLSDLTPEERMRRLVARARSGSRATA